MRLKTIPKSIIDYVEIRDGLIFLGSTLFTTSISYLLFGVKSLMWTAFASMLTYSLYNARPENNNRLYIFFWMMLIMVSSYFGYLLKTSWLFYVYLFVASCFFFISFGKDPVMDRAVRYIIMLSTIGTTIPAVSYELPLGYLIGTGSVLVFLYILHLQNYDFNAFKNGLFSKEFYTSDKYTIPKAFVFSTGMYLSLLVPHFFHLGRAYWAPLTFVVVLNPKAERVFDNTLYRFAGNFVSILLLMMMLATVDDASSIMLIAFFAVAFMLPTLLDKNPVLRSFGTSLYALTMMEISHYWDNPLYSPLFERIYEPLIGGGIAIMTSFILKRLRAIQ